MDAHWWNWDEARWVPSVPADAQSGEAPGDAQVPLQRPASEPSADDLHRAAESVALQRPPG
jgi:hypothetical protein